MKTNTEISALEKQAKEDENRLTYHLMPPIGWLNDPNGSCQFKGVYHFYYQYAPENPLGSTKYWGHYTTQDFIHYKKEETALFPDTAFDKNGVYSGCAFIEEETMHLFYTGNVKHIGEYDYITAGREHNTMHVSSQDGFTFTKKECVLNNSMYPSDLTLHVRDPHVIKKEDVYYMFLGARTKEDVGICLVYQSSNLTDWKVLKRLTSKTPFGYMWECPCFVEFDNQQVLICCPQGVTKQGYQFEALYQNGYFLIENDFRKECTLSNFIELDYGFDYYAQQVYKDNQGRQLMIGWMGLPDVEYQNPTVEKGWQHALALPRELTLKKQRIYQYPIKEIELLRKHKQVVSLLKNQEFTCHQKAFEMQIEVKNTAFKIHLRQDCILSYKDGLFTFTMGESGKGREQKHIEIETIETISIFSDTSSLEIFINHGQAALTTRVYDKKIPTFKANINCVIEYYDLDGYCYL